MRNPPTGGNLTLDFRVHTFGSGAAVGIDLGFKKIINDSVSGGILKIFFYK